MADRVITGYGLSIKFVDLGLPSGTLWASLWLGATDDNPYGDYTYVDSIKYVAENFNPNEDVVYPNFKQIEELYNSTIRNISYKKDYSIMIFTSRYNGEKISLALPGYLNDNNDYIGLNLSIYLYTYMRQNFVTYFGDDDSTNIIRNNFNVNEAKYLKKNINTTNRIPILLCTNRKKNTIITKTNYLQDVLFFTLVEEGNYISLSINTTSSSAFVFGVVQKNLYNFSASFLYYSPFDKKSSIKLRISKKNFYLSDYLIIASKSYNKSISPIYINKSVYGLLYSSGKYNIYIDANKYRFSTIYGEKNPIGDFINAQHNNNGEVISLWDFDFRKTSVAPQLSYSLWRDGYKYSIIKNCIPLFNKAKALQYFNFDTEESYFIPKNFSSFTLGSTFKLNNSKIYFFPNKDVKYFIYCLEDRMFVIFISNTTTGVSFAYLYDANMFYTIYTPVEGYFTTSFLNFGVKFVSCLDVSQYNKEDLNGLQLFWSNCISLFKDLKSRDAHKIKLEDFLGYYEIAKKKFGDLLFDINSEYGYLNKDQLVPPLYLPAIVKGQIYLLFKIIPYRA